MTSQPRRAFLLGTLVLALAASACSNAADPQLVSAPQTTSIDSPDALALDTPSTLGEPSFDDVLGPAGESSEGEANGADDETAGSTGGAAPTTQSNGGAGTPSPPPGTAGVPPNYTGALGHLDPNALLFGPIAPLPTAVAGHWPLTGLAGGSNRPAVVVKIDNSSKARPQAGLNAADVVIEEEVESGITRLAAIFHTSDAVVGPVRSGRTTDLGFLHSLGGAGLAYSGANTTTDTLLRLVTEVANYSAARSGGYWRESGRSAPSNLFANTSSFRSTGSSPPAWFDFGSNTIVGTPQSTIDISFPASRASWAWNGAAWLRSQNGTSHLTAEDEQVSAANVIVVEAPRVATGMVDSVGSVVPEFVWAGQGRAVVFTEGIRYEGVWTRSRLSEPAVFSTTAGEVIRLAPGRTWIELVETGAFLSG